MSNEAYKLFHEGNIWHGELYIREYKGDKYDWNWTSPRYLCGAVAFEIFLRSSNARVQGSNWGQVITTIFIKFVKIFQDDDLLYTCNVKRHPVIHSAAVMCSADSDLSLEFHTQEFQHEILYIVTERTGFSFKLDVTCDIATGNHKFAPLFEDTELANFKLCGKDGSVSVHSHILAAVSPVMRTMLSGNWKETSEGQVNIADTSKKTLEDLKEYIYLDKLPEEGIEELLILGTFYEISDLILKCTVKLMNKLNTGNILKLIELACQYKVANLQYGILNTLNNTMSVHEGSICINKLNSEMMGSKSGNSDAA